MKREALFEIIHRTPAVDQTKLVIVMRCGYSITADLFYRMEEEYVVIRGREAGTNDDGRGFFIPYDEIAYVRLERVVKVNDLRRMYGDPISAEQDGALADELTADPTPTPTGTPVPASAPPVGTGPADPAAIAKNNLLERIRAARTSAGVPRK